MKRFLLFTYYTYYPSGGMNDFQESFDTLEEAQQYVDSSEDCEPWTLDHQHVWDSETGQVVWKNHMEEESTCLPRK